MLKRFLDHLKRENIDLANKRVLLAISGGKDSMMMVSLFKEAKIDIGVAHLNHQLREEESDRDAKFVSNFCSENSIPFFLKSLNIKEAVSSTKSNMHDYSRTMRYQFFNEIASNENFHLIATAHHRGDSIETVLINFFRGSGLPGLSGIPFRNANVIRPLLFCSRKEIDQYIDQNNIPFIEDSSNSQHNYLRNRVRHNVIPVIENIFPAINKSGYRSIENLNDANKLLKSFVEQWMEVHCQIINGSIHIAKSALQKMEGELTLTYMILQPFGFSRDQCLQLTQSIEQIGNNFYSASHRLLIDRDFLILTGNRASDLEAAEITMGDNFFKNYHLALRNVPTWQIESSSDIAYLDKRKLSFPLTLRKWKDGDRFSPLGLSGSQKIKDYLINNKVDQIRKENTYVLLSNNEICWLVGHQISDLFKIVHDSREILQLTFKKDLQEDV